jgi:hypothetical protein
MIQTQFVTVLLVVGGIRALANAPRAISLNKQSVPRIPLGETAAASQVTVPTTSSTSSSTMTPSPSPSAPFFARWARRTGNDASSCQSALALPQTDALYKEYETTFISALHAYLGSPVTVALASSHEAFVSYYVMWLAFNVEGSLVNYPTAIALNADLSVRWVNPLDELGWLRSSKCVGGFPEPVADATASSSTPVFSRTVLAPLDSFPLCCCL